MMLQSPIGVLLVFDGAPFIKETIMSNKKSNQEVKTEKSKKPIRDEHHKRMMRIMSEQDSADAFNYMMVCGLK